MQARRASEGIRFIRRKAARIPLLALRAWMAAGLDAELSHARPKREREESVSSTARRPVFPCLRCGLGWLRAPMQARRASEGIRFIRRKNTIVS